MTKIQIYEGADGRWYWRAQHSNGNITADGSEGYSTKSNAVRAARKIGASLVIAPVRVISRGDQQHGR